MSAVELGLFTELASGPQGLEAIKARLHLHPRAARDFLDTLVVLGFLSPSGDRYANTPETEFFLDRTKPSYMMGNILHDWDLPTKRMLIEKAFNALPAARAFVVYDSIIDDARSANAFGLMMSLNMLIEIPGGFDDTGADCRGWMTDAGFTATRVEPLVGPDSMVIGIK